MLIGNCRRLRTPSATIVVGAAIRPWGNTVNRTRSVLFGSGAGSRPAKRSWSGWRGRNSLPGVAATAAQQCNTVGRIGVAPSLVSTTKRR